MEAPRHDGTQSELRRFHNRELSWIAFNRRVLEEATGQHNPWLERARFLAIVASNLDEFCMVRYAELVKNVAGNEVDPSRLTPREQLDRSNAELQQLVADQYACWSDVVEPGLEALGFRIVPAAAWTTEERASLQTVYRKQIEPTLTPLAVDPTRPFPKLAGARIHIAVELETGGHRGTASFQQDGHHHALVSVPASARLIPLGTGNAGYALLEDVVEAFLEGLFPGSTILGKVKFRITRDGSLEIDEDHAGDLLEEMEEELRQRANGPPVRLEIESDVDAAQLGWLREQLELDQMHVFAVSGPLDLTMLMGIDDWVVARDHCFKPFQPRAAPKGWSDPFAAIRKQDHLLHHPFDDFQAVTDLINRAADDSDVLAIKQTLYRVSGSSPIVRALMRAARSGKQVTVIVELKARFDEERNIKWARQLEEAGAHVVYGLVGLKVHAKLLLIIRRDQDGIRRYCHVGTGNFNDKTARLYTDLSMITANHAVGRDVSDLFNMLTGFSVPPDWERLAVSPLTMRSSFSKWIDREIAHAQAGRGGRIIAKFNSLVDTAICDELYAASAAGVEIDLVVRGMCILRAGVPGLSETIRVRSVVGRFLEHSRLFYFANDGSPLYAISSADWMTRNLDRRVEALVTVTDPKLQDRLDDLLALYLADNASARVAAPDGSYHRMQPSAGEQRNASQDQLLEQLAVPAKSAIDERPRRAFKPLGKSPER